MRTYRTKKYKSHRALRIIAVIVAIIAALTIGLGIFINKNVDPIIISFCKEQIRKITYNCVNQAALEVISDNVATNKDLVSIVYDKDGNIQMLNANAQQISTTSSKITMLAQEKVEENSETGIQIPYGSLTGITFLTGLGPNFNVKVYSVSSSKTSIGSSFVSGGINQTLHKITLTVTTTVTIAVPGMRSEITADTDVLMNECIIVGKVPDTFLNATDIGDMLNLIAG